MSKTRKRLVVAVSLLLFLAVVPRILCDRDVDAYWSGRGAAVDGLAAQVASQVRAGSLPDAHHTGSDHMNAEWAYVTAMMSVIGLSNAAHGDAAFHAEARRIACEVLVAPQTLRFGSRLWGETYASAKHGHAYLGWGALALGHARALDPAFAQTKEHDEMIALLRNSLEASPHGVFETFPGVTFPPDVAVSLGAVALHNNLTGHTHDALVARAVDRFMKGFVDKSSGYVWQQANPANGAGRDGPRGSGTAISAYALGFADREAATTLRASLLANRRSLAGFYAVREYGDGSFGLGDIDSGPVLLGVSVAATGFSIGAFRQGGEKEAFRGMVRTMTLFGLPWRSEGRQRHLTGGALGDAVLLAMLTAERP